MDGISKPSSQGSMLTAAEVEMLSGTISDSPRIIDSAMEKQPAWAAAINSSGLVPSPLSKRVANEYWVSDNTPLSVDMAPLPSLRPPSQTADALRFMVVSC